MPDGVHAAAETIPVHKLGDDEGGDQFPDVLRICFCPPRLAIREPVVQLAILSFPVLLLLPGRTVGIWFWDDRMALHQEVEDRQT